MPTHYDTLPDIAIGRHPDYGIVAANPKQHTPNAWMLKSLDFHPVPDQPTLYALANQLQDGQGRTTRAVALLRRAGYEVDTDAAFDPSPTSCPTHARDRAPQVGPDVAFADLPELGVVAATGPPSSELASRLILEEHGWRQNPRLGVYTLPSSVDRGEALEKLARATVSMHRSDLQVAVQPLLAANATTRLSPAPAPAARREPGQGITTAAALAASPARTGLPSKPRVPAPAASAPATAPVDPRIAFSRNR
ncbi:hypothetical protein OG244_03575 [Streptomyces brevispora]|uniref:hypothetical protein n=1 Tax=Streptomyces brevispora TaxID=887462 RepID=UPI002E3525CE|nr:hypothetical protein [Streptomyces brevispora]